LKSGLSFPISAPAAAVHRDLSRTLEANLPAVRLALSLGYTRYAQHLAVRLNADKPPQ